MVMLSENEGIDGQVFVVTGGLSSVGAALCLELVERGAQEVRSFDSRSSSPLLPALLRKRVVCITGDIKRKEETDKALCGANCVFHLASYGISGKEMLRARKIDEVNLTGTCNILDSCVKYGVERLVFASSYNVVFGGQEIVDGNENMGYFPIDTHLDSYGRCKALAEQIVLKSNGRPLKSKSGGKLHTCAIRPAPVYGPHEEHHLPRLLDLAQKGMLLCVIGGPEVKTDWVYVDNLVQALLLASMGLLDDIPGRLGAPACGQAYFISDGAPINPFKFLQPLLEGLGYQLPNQRLSVKSAMTLAWFFWGLYGLLYPWLDKAWLPEPPVLPAEVHSVGVTHYFSTLKARQQLGYVPHVAPKEGLQRTLEFWRNERAKGVLSPELFYWISIVGILIVILFCAFVPAPFLGPFEWTREGLLLILRTQKMIQITFILSCIVHVGEGGYAWLLAKRVDPANANGWFWQTFFVGFPSLLLLRSRARHLSKS
ncbi:hypothetical protein GOP47_0022762 [Adiantum capillus-veneris]|uniref:3-beta hydroxysteroid dehydrogenase/isomerase domain-containing protein n=1 Tax=Adiantum capillus-veneris TaxID=13818 RepID=A0A9D4U736_ADICA|nr:hypothetical protein GOP47_0022762 [Adiantum capillus-veneris]